MTEASVDITSLFADALEKETPAEREAYLSMVCRGDAALRQKIEALLKAYGEANDVPDTPLVDMGFIQQETSLTEAPGTVIGRYKLLEKIGEGGMAVVYMAEQQEPIRRKVALKIIKLGMDTRQVIARFEAERQALALMDHPSIAKVLDAGATETGRPYFVMELVTGVSITEYCDRNSLSTKERLALFLQVCHAVQHAHQKGIIHRDLKPSNVMVTHHDGKPVPKVIDFGIAKATNQRLTEKTLFTRYAHIIGTPAYMSPEQAELSDLDIDTRSDIYSLGVLLYELLTGTTPFSEEELRKAGYVEMQRVICEQEPAKPSTKLSTLGETLTDIANHRGCTPDLLRKAVRGDLDWIVMKSLEKDRARRYETASGLAEDVQRHLKHEPVLARGPGAPYRLRKFLRRHRVETLVGLTIGVLIAVVVLVVWMWNQNRLQLAEAEAFRDEGILSQARGQYARREHQAALETLTAILHSKHVGPKARLLHASILVEDRQFEEAATVLADLVNERAEIAGAAHSLLARILGEGESVSAETLKQIEEHRRQAATLLPETPEAYFLQATAALTVKEQLAALNKALELGPDHYESLRLRAFTYYASRKYDRMRDDALGMTYLRGSDPLGYSLRAIALRELGKYTDALVEYDRALARTPKEDPQYLDLATQRCEMQLRMGDYRRVLAEAKACQELWPDKAVFQYCMFCALTALGEYEQAEGVYRQILSPSHTARGQFGNWCAKYVFDCLHAGRSWFPSEKFPEGAAFLPLVEAEETYHQLSAKGKLVTTRGFTPCWSPDGKKLAFSLGVVGSSGIALYDPATQETELLIVPGKEPSWSPDGQYIAFVREFQIPRLEQFVGAKQKPEERLAVDQEVWVMRSDGTAPRRLARGASPSWGKDSTHVYYESRLDPGLYSVSIEGGSGEPQRVMICPGAFPVVSPDGQRVAYAEYKSLKVMDLATQTLVAEWPEPFSTYSFRSWSWSPKGDELYMGSTDSLDGRAGLWIFRFDRSEAVRVLDGPIWGAGWARNGTRLVFHLGSPYSEIWNVDMGTNAASLETLGPGGTPEEYFEEMVAVYTRRTEVDPQDAYAYARRARYHERLHDRAKADTDMKRWSAISSQGSSPGPDVRSAGVSLTVGEPINLGPTVNTAHNEASPCISFDGLELYFNSNRPGGQGDWDLWMARRATTEAPWGEPVNLGPSVNTAGWELGPSVSADGLDLYFMSDRGGNPDIWVSTRATVSDPWRPAANLGSIVNTSYFDEGPSISRDGLELFFCCSGLRLPAYGREDLWMVTRATVHEPWRAPVNLDAVVNTPYVEYAPALSADGLLLFFHSDRPGGCGGNDIWVTRRTTKNDRWAPAINPGPPLNTIFSETVPSVSADGRLLYFTSHDRPGGLGATDLWQASIISVTDFNGNGTVKGKEN